MQLAKGLFPPDGTNVFVGNLVVRPVGLRKGWNDIQSGERTYARTNAMMATSETVYKPIGPVRILDGTHEEPIDLGFAHVPEMVFDPRLSADPLGEDRQLSGCVEEPGSSALRLEKCL